MHSERPRCRSTVRKVGRQWRYRTMYFLDILMAHRNGSVRFLSIVAMVATGVYLSVFRDWDWYLWAPASALVYLVLPVLWGWFDTVDIGIRPRNVYKGTDVNLY